MSDHSASFPSSGGPARTHQPRALPFDPFAAFALILGWAAGVSQLLLLVYLVTV